MSERIRRAFATWKSREVVSNRLLATGVGILLLVVPINLYVVIAGPTGGDRLAAAGFALVGALFAVYSLWEAKSPTTPRRSRRDGDGS